MAAALKLSPRQIDDIRVAALLFDFNNIEITTKVLNRALVALDGDPGQNQAHTFRGIELVDSLGSILTGAMPLLADQDDSAHESGDATGGRKLTDMPIGARIIRAARAFYDSTDGAPEIRRKSTHDALTELKADEFFGQDHDVLHALEQTVAAGPLESAIDSELEELLALQS
jgi:HD-GYP domain-containing protein (c-di-GMP phosphodiesterase class II)